MGKYLLRRILQMIPVVLGTTLLVYALVFALPGDPVKAMFGDKPVNDAVAAQIRAEYHLDQPFIVQYFIYLKNALTLNFGDTFAGQPVLDEIARAFPVTIRLGLMAFVFEAIFGVVFGIISGLKKGKWYDTVILIVSLLLISVPTFVTGFVMQYVFGIQWASPVPASPPPPWPCWVCCPAPVTWSTAPSSSTARKSPAPSRASSTSCAAPRWVSCLRTR